MSYNKQKMVNLILNECESIEERCDGYRKAVLDAIVDILNAEKEHQAQKTTIQKHVNRACHKAGDFLAKNSDTDNSATEATE